MILNLKLDYNPETETVKVKSCSVEHEIKEDSKRVVESNEPQVLLETGKYTLNPAAVELMQVVPNMRLDIKYQMINGVEYPVIGGEEAFGVAGGNKVTKSFTVSYRGKAYDRLSKFGDTFTVTPMMNATGLYILVGNCKQEEIPDEIEIKEDLNNHSDIVSMDEEPLTFEDEPLFDDMDDATLIDADSLKFD